MNVIHTLNYAKNQQNNKNIKKKKHRNKITKLLKSFKWKCVNMFILYMTRKCKNGFFNNILI